MVSSILSTAIVALIVIAVVCLAIASILKDKKSGKSSCGENCAHCALHGQCHNRENKVGKNL